MCKSINRRNSYDNDTYIEGPLAVGHTKQSTKDILSDNKIIKKNINQVDYIITYTGDLYNCENLKKVLKEKGYSFSSNSHAEVILYSYIVYGNDCVKMLEGVFSFAIICLKDNNMFLARDRLGIKPLFYTIQNDTLVFASEIKALFEHPLVKAIVSEREIMEMLALGPAHNPGNTYFKNIFELKPGHIATYKGINFNSYKYWDLETKDYSDNIKEAISNVKDLVTNSLKTQLVSDVPICTMLSGGLDSSVLTYLAKSELGKLSTFSIDFADNSTSFTSNIYQPTQDSEYVKIMSDYLSTNHKTISFENKDLFDLLEQSMICRDMPGMADIDASMLAFCKKINENGFKIALSGECSDEIFGGYPWYYREKLLNYESFPWALSDDIREKIIKKDICNIYTIRDYIKNSYDNTINNVVLNSSDEFENKFRKINYLTIKWFMNTLIERTDRTSMYSGLEVRIPFADYKLFEYVYNLPAKYKLGLVNSNELVEKYLLRKAFEGNIPNSIIHRKKSPFPKTYSENYLKLVTNKIKEIINNPDSPLLQIIDKIYLTSIIDSEGKILNENWFGQLMTYPQTLAYLIQINMWLEKYNIKLEI